MVKVFFATNRRPDNRENPTDFGTDFNEDGLASLRFGEAEVTGEELDTYSLKVAPEKIVKVSTEERLPALDANQSTFGSAAVLSEIRREMLDQDRDTVIFVHGYNVSFREALTSAARLELNFSEQGLNVNVVLFSWPSDGSMMPFLAYGSDRQDAAASGPAFARGFLKLADFLCEATKQDECEQSIHLITHSMGNFVLRHAVQEIVKQSPGRPPRVFDQVLMMAADEDDDTFEYAHKLQPLPKLAKRVNVYFNNEDLAMTISDKTKGHPDRLGADGPRLPRQVPGKVTQIDCTPVVGGVLEHSYFLDSPRVVKDMVQVLAGKAPNEVEGRNYDPASNHYRLTPE